MTTRQDDDWWSRISFKDRARDARLAAARNLKKWIGYEDGDYAVLSGLLGIPTVEILHGMTEEHVRLCELLGGPHGWTIYKALLARQAEVPHD